MLCIVLIDPGMLSSPPSYPKSTQSSSKFCNFENASPTDHVHVDPPTKDVRPDAFSKLEEVGNLSLDELRAELAWTQNAVLERLQVCIWPCVCVIHFLADGLP